MKSISSSGAKSLQTEISFQEKEAAGTKHQCMMRLLCLRCRNAQPLRCRFSLKRAWDQLSGERRDDESARGGGIEVVREMVAESVAAMVMAMDDTRLGTRWWKRRCRHGSRETGSNWHKPATGRVDNDAPSEREREREKERETTRDDK